MHDLNADPELPFADESFDDAVCCVSVDYLDPAGRGDRARSAGCCGPAGRWCARSRTDVAAALAFPLREVTQPSVGTPGDRGNNRKGRTRATLVLPMLLRRLSLGAAAALALAAPAAPAHASGVTTHAFMAEAAIPFVTDPGLRTLLEAHPNEVITGGHFPDGGYAAGGYGEVTHWERFVNAYTDHLRARTDCAPITAPDGPCAQQVAFLMGIAAHGIGDERWDWLFEPKLADLGESPVHPAYSTYSQAGLPGAAELMGLPPGSLINTPEFALDNIALVEFDRLRSVPSYVPPTSDLVEVYKDLGREDVSAAGISEGQGAILAAAAGERAGVGAEYPRVKLTAPRVSALYYTGTGGVLDVAQAAAGYYLAIWQKLQSSAHPAPVVTAVNPAPDQTGVPFLWHPVKSSPGPTGGGSENRIMASISQSLDVTTITAEDFRLYGPDGEQLAQEQDFPRPGPYGAGDGTHTLMLWPKDDLEPCTRYTAELRPGVKDYAGAGLRVPYAWSFTTRSSDGEPCPAVLTEPDPDPKLEPGPAGGGGLNEAPAAGPGSGGTTTMQGPSTDPAVVASPQQIRPPAGEDGALGLPATSVVAIRSLQRTRGQGRMVRVLVSCLGPDACSGTLRLYAPRGPRSRKLGARSYRIAPLKTQRIGFTLPRAARRELGRTRRLALEVRAAQRDVRGGRGAVASRAFVLRQVALPRRR